MCLGNLDNDLSGGKRAEQMPIRRRILRGLLGAFLGLAIVATGCGRERMQPVSDTDWRDHLSVPAGRVARNWVLSDNTMLVEVDQGFWSGLYSPYWYEVYDPRLKASSVVIPLAEHGVVRKIDDQRVEFVCDSDRGLPYLAVYDIATRQTSTRAQNCPVGVPRQLGLSNVYTLLQAVVADGTGVHLTVRYSEHVPFMKIAGDKSSRILVVELPGQDYVDSVLGPVASASAAPLTESVTVQSGVRGRDGRTVPGLTIRIKTTSSDWENLTYSISGAYDSGVSRFTLCLSEDEQPLELGLTLDAPEGWGDWREKIERSVSPISSTLELADGTVLIGFNSGRTWLVYEPQSTLSSVILGEADWPRLQSVSDSEVQFLCQGMHPAYPYLKVYDIETRAMVSRDVWLDLEESVEFGSPYSVVYSACAASEEGITFSFKEGPVMAGGGGPPTTRTWADEMTHSFCIEFPGAPTDGLSFGTPDLGAVPFVESATLTSGVRGPDGEEAPGVTLRLTLEAAKWSELTYNIAGRPDPDPDKAARGCPVLILSFADNRTATNIDVLKQP